MKIDVKYVDTTKHFDVFYKPEYSGFILSRFNHDTKNFESVLLSGICFYPIDSLERTIRFYQVGYDLNV